MLRKNTASQFIHFQGVDATTGGIKSGVTWTMRRCIDGTFAAGGGTVTEDSTNGWYKCALTQADTNGNDIAYNFTGTGAVPQTINVITTACDPTTATNFGITALPTTAVTTNASLLTSGTGTDQLSVTTGRIDVGKLLGTAWLTPGTAGTPDVNAKLLGGTAQTGRDIGASVLLSTGTGTGQLDFTSGVVKANATQWVGGTIPAVNVTGVPLVDLKYTLGTISPATAGSVRADAVSGAVGSVTGAVGSVTGAVGSVTGSVGSVTGLTASNLDATISSRATPAQILTTALTESYAGQGVVPTLAQIMFESRALQAEKAVSGTTLTAKKIDGSTTAATYTLNDAVAPSAITRAT